ncbi:MAG: hypothetical protein AAGJ87_15125 [Pseudomonadota bacterium]
MSEIDYVAALKSTLADDQRDALVETFLAICVALSRARSLRGFQIAPTFETNTLGDQADASCFGYSHNDLFAEMKDAVIGTLTERAEAVREVLIDLYGVPDTRLDKLLKDVLAMHGFSIDEGGA